MGTFIVFEISTAFVPQAAKQRHFNGNFAQIITEQDRALNNSMIGEFFIIHQILLPRPGARIATIIYPEPAQTVQTP